MSKPDYTTEIVNFNVDWNFIKEGCMATIGKGAGKTPNTEWRQKLLICQHSPIRRGVVSWKWQGIPYSNMGHFVRHHVGCTPFVSTSRSDRTGIDRDERKQTDLVSMEMDANIQSLIDMAGRRLCLQSDPVTRTYMKSLVEQIEKYDKTLAWRLVPQCINYGACIEPFGNCKYFDSFAEELTKEELTDMTKRLNKYHDYRNKM